MTEALKAEDAKIQTEKEIVDKAKHEKDDNIEGSEAKLQGESRDIERPEPVHTTEHFMMTTESVTSQATSPSTAISDEVFATDDIPMDAINRELFAPMDASSPASSRGAKRPKSTSAKADFEDRAAAQTRKYPESEVNSPDSGPSA